MSDYPDCFIRGITKPKYVYEDGGVDPQAFEIYTSEDREDDHEEISINWEDNEDVIPFSLDQRNQKGHVMFQAGVVRVPRDECDRISNEPAFLQKVSYERAETPDNPYHGNILIQKNLAKPRIRAIQGALAIRSSLVITKASY